MTKWRGVPQEFSVEWRAAFASQSEGINVSSPCPVCKSMSLRRFFGSTTPSENMPQGFIGKGASWEWCSACGVYEHASCLVPVWWRPIKIKSERSLTAVPEQLVAQLCEAGYA